MSYSGTTAVGYGHCYQQYLLPVILADEPTGSLDAAAGMQVITLLDTLCRQHGCTLVVVTHDVHIAALAQHRLRMIDGYLKEA